MPLAADTNEKFRVVLKSDENKPEEKRPWFEFRYRSIREIRQINRAIDDVKHYATDDKDLEKLLAILRENLTGWGNQFNDSSEEVPFDPARIDEIISLSEIGELLIHLTFQGLTAADRKNSGSPSPSAAAAAVKIAPD